MNTFTIKVLFTLCFSLFSINYFAQAQSKQDAEIDSIIAKRVYQQSYWKPGNFDMGMSIFCNAYQTQVGIGLVPHLSLTERLRLSLTPAFALSLEKKVFDVSGVLLQGFLGLDYLIFPHKSKKIIASAGLGYLSQTNEPNSIGPKTFRVYKYDGYAGTIGLGVEARFARLNVRYMFANINTIGFEAVIMLSDLYKNPSTY